MDLPLHSEHECHDKCNVVGVGTARDFFQAPCLGGLTPDKGTGCLYDLNRNLYGNVVSYLRYWNVYGEPTLQLESGFSSRLMARILLVAVNYIKNLYDVGCCIHLHTSYISRHCPRVRITKSKATFAARFALKQLLGRTGCHSKPCTNSPQFGSSAS
jgi:hypothetical protein